ncbi:MAG: hypothetical protein ABIR16_01520 [Dokdonella sp.]
MKKPLDQAQRLAHLMAIDRKAEMARELTTSLGYGRARDRLYSTSIAVAMVEIRALLKVLIKEGERAAKAAHRELAVRAKAGRSQQ